jgi:UDP:flavonoid glycosyltransferase YjiC (YdhE family)
VGGGETTPSSERQRAYVGFGTVPLFRDAPDLMLAAAAALLSAGFDVTATTPDPSLARQLERLDPSRVQVHEWVDLPAVVARCRLVVCHGGAGTVLAALAAGVPLVLLPRGAPSQLRMSAACETRGVGRVVDGRDANAGEVAAAVVEVASNPRFRSRAEEVAGEIAAMPEPAQAVTQLLEVANRGL